MIFKRGLLSEEISQVNKQAHLLSSCFPSPPLAMLECSEVFFQVFWGGRLTGINFASGHCAQPLNIAIGGREALPHTTKACLWAVSMQGLLLDFSLAKFLPTTAWIDNKFLNFVASRVLFLLHSQSIKTQRSPFMEGRFCGLRLKPLGVRALVFEG